MTDALKQAGAKRNQEPSKSWPNSSRKSCRVENHLASRAYVHKNVEKLVQEAVHKLDDRVINKADQTVFDALETSDVEHNKALFEGALRGSLNGLLIFFLDGSSSIREVFEDAIIYVETTLKPLAIIAFAIMIAVTGLAPNAWYAAEFLKQIVENPANDLVVTPLCPRHQVWARLSARLKKAPSKGGLKRSQVSKTICVHRVKISAP